MQNNSWAIMALLTKFSEHNWQIIQCKMTTDDLEAVRVKDC